MTINKAGLDLIKSFEGLRLKAYLDPVGILTIGYGHTSRAGPPMVRTGMRITREEAEIVLARDLLNFEVVVDAALTRAPTQNQRAAMVSLAYNIGPAGFLRSSVRRNFNAGDDEAAARAFRLWDKAGGRVLPGLARRRAAETALFLAPETARQTTEASTGRRGTAGLPTPTPTAVVGVAATPLTREVQHGVIEMSDFDDTGVRKNAPKSSLKAIGGWSAIVAAVGTMFDYWTGWLSSLFN